MARHRLRFGSVAQTVEPKLVSLVHQVAACGRVLDVTGADACFLGDNKAACPLRQEVPGVKVAVAGFGFVGAVGNPADALVGNELGDAGVDGAVEDLEAVERALADVAGRLKRDVFNYHEPVGPVRGVGEAGKGVVAVGVEQQLVVAENRRDGGAVGGGPVDGGVAVGAVGGQLWSLGRECGCDRKKRRCGKSEISEYRDYPFLLRAISFRRGDEVVAADELCTVVELRPANR